MLTQEDLGARVRGVVHKCDGSIVKVHNATLADIRWDYGARWDWQTLGRDFEVMVPQPQEVKDEF